MRKGGDVVAWIREQMRGVGDSGIDAEHKRRVTVDHLIAEDEHARIIHRRESADNKIRRTNKKGPIHEGKFNGVAPFGEWENYPFDSRVFPIQVADGVIMSPRRDSTLIALSYGSVLLDQHVKA